MSDAKPLDAAESAALDLTCCLFPHSGLAKKVKADFDYGELLEDWRRVVQLSIVGLLIASILFGLGTAPLKEKEFLSYKVPLPDSVGVFIVSCVIGLAWLSVALWIVLSVFGTKLSPWRAAKIVVTSLIGCIVLAGLGSWAVRIGAQPDVAEGLRHLLAYHGIAILIISVFLGAWMLLRNVWYWQEKDGRTPRIRVATSVIIVIGMVAATFGYIDTANTSSQTTTIGAKAPNTATE